MNTHKALLWANTIFRVIIPFFIFWNPVLITILSVVGDAVDGDIFQRVGIKKGDYQTIDKFLDLYWYVFIMIYALGIEFKDVFLFLFIFRMVGNVLFFLIKDQRILIIFPNIFETFFFVYLLALVFPGFGTLLQGQNLFLTMLLITLVKLVNEIIIHGVHVDISDLLTGKRTKWAT